MPYESTVLGRMRNAAHTTFILTSSFNSIYFPLTARNIKPDDLVLPRPPLSVEGYNTVTLSWVAAMKYVGMSKYSEDLTYSSDVPESMNDASLEDGVVEPLPRRVEEIFREFKMNLSQGAVRRKLVHLFIDFFHRPPLILL